MPPTVYVEEISGYNAVKMIWAHDVDRHDVTVAFKHLQTMVESSSTPLYVVLDLQNKPRMPLQETMSGALTGPYRHPMLAEWLVIGSSMVARSIERSLAAIAKRQNMRWFETEADAFAYLDSATQVHRVF
jgi:hypothetical protein